MTAITRKGLLKKKEILHSTELLMKKEKYDNITVKQICEAAHVSIGTFYHYFDHKDLLAVEIFREIDVYMEDVLAQTLNSHDEIENINRYCVGYGMYTREKGVCFCQSMNSIYLDPKLYSRSMERRRPIFQVLKKLIERGLKKGQIAAFYEPNGLAETIILILRGANFDWARRGGEYDLTEEIREMANRMTTLLRVREAPDEPKLS